MHLVRRVEINGIWVYEVGHYDPQGEWHILASYDTSLPRWSGTGAADAAYAEANELNGGPIALKGVLERIALALGE